MRKQFRPDFENGSPLKKKLYLTKLKFSQKKQKKTSLENIFKNSPEIKSQNLLKEKSKMFSKCSYNQLKTLNDPVVLDARGQ